MVSIVGQGVHFLVCSEQLFKTARSAQVDAGTWQNKVHAMLDDLKNERWFEYFHDHLTNWITVLASLDMLAAEF